MHWDDARVATVVRPLDRTLNVLKFALVPTLALALSLSVVMPIFDSSTRTSEDLILGVVGPLVAAIYLLLLQTQSVGSRIDKAFAQLRRWVALACNHDYAATHERGGIACRLTPDVFQAPLFRYGRQKELVEHLSRACDQEPTGEFWFVEGKSGSGKTRAALRLVQGLVRDSRLFELGTRCYLYDFSKSKAMQRKLIRSIRSPRHVGAVILVDNFQLVESDVLNELTDLLLEGSAVHAQLVVFLARPREAWNLSPGADVRLLSEAKAAGRHVELHGALTEVVEEKVSKVDAHVSRLVGSLQDSKYASAVQMQLAQVIARNKSVPEDVLTILRLLDVEQEKAAAGDLPHRLARLLGVLAALSVHRGSFSRKDLRRAIRTVGKEHGVLVGANEMLQLYTSFRRLRRMGLISKIHLDGPSFLLHEAVAELCIDRLWEVSEFSQALQAVGGQRLQKERVGEEPVVAWQLATEVGDQNSMLEQFEDALAVGANLEMIACLRRAHSRYEFTGATRLQQAILLDRIGDFVESRQTFADASVAGLESSNDLAVLLAVSRIEANHFQGFEADLELLKNHREPIVTVIGEYWETHIETHSGRFDSDRLLQLAAETLDLIKEDSPFWQVHSLSRMHFDSLRSFYLSGRSDVGSLTSPPRRQINGYLHKRLPIFKAMNTLYSRAHLVGHVHLPRLALLGERLGAEDAALAGLELPEPNVPDLCEAMLTLYRQAKDEFWQYGDREANYLQADVLNAEMVQPGASMDDESLLKGLETYEHFIVSNDFNSLNSYPHFYYLRWNVLKRQEVLLGGHDATQADAYLSDAERHLAKIAELDRIAGNVYGQLRADLLSVLIQGLNGKIDEGELVALRSRMAAQGYGFESDLLSHLIERGGTLKQAELVQMVRFYPFVHQ